MIRKCQIVPVMLVLSLGVVSACASKDEKLKAANAAANHPIAAVIPAPTQPSTPLAPPTRGMIREAQTNLRQMGLYQGKIDGVAGPMTNAAVKQYQTAKGLTPSGEIDPITFASLGPAGRSTTPPTAAQVTTLQPVATPPAPPAAAPAAPQQAGETVPVGTHIVN